MARFNLYKIERNKQDALIQKFSDVGLVMIHQNVGDAYTTQFYFSEDPDDVEIWWADEYRAFFGERPVPMNQMYFAAYVIFNNSNSYVVSLGKTHFYLKSFCDVEFGLNLAERILDEKNLKIKNSKFFKSKRSKSIVSYQSNSEIEYDSGESLYYIKGKTIDSATWGKAVSFGQSVGFNLDIPPNELPELLLRIENVLREPGRLSLPKTVKVDDPNKMQELDERLSSAIIQYGNGQEIQFNEFQVLGIDFVFSDRDNFSLYLRGKSDERIAINELSISNLVSWLNLNNINLSTNINDIKLFISNEGGRGHSAKLKEYLDYVDDERYCLINGDWHRFNQSYIDHLHKEVNGIKLESDDTIIRQGLSESEFNEDQTNHGYINCDRDLETMRRYRIEKMDLYKDNTLYFVKFGIPQKLAYVIDQSNNTVKILQNTETVISVGGVNLDIQKICIWIGLRRVTPVRKLSELNSIIFHMKLVEWKRLVSNAGYIPIVKINLIG